MNDFLLLSVLFACPGAIIYAVRPDLRPLIGANAIASLPFALTERFFAGSYWSPPSLFQLIDRVGVGIEDGLFVVALAAYMSTAYAFVFRKRLVAMQSDGSARQSLARALLIVGVALGGTAVLLSAGMPIIYGCFSVMGAISLGIVVVRRDLLSPALLGSLLSVTTYACVCLVYAALRPGVFSRVWHTERFMHRFVLGVPIEEILYGWLSGVVASVFYPLVARMRFVKLDP